MGGEDIVLKTIQEDLPARQQAPMNCAGAEAQELQHLQWHCSCITHRAAKASISARCSQERVVKSALAKSEAILDTCAELKAFGV